MFCKVLHQLYGRDTRSAQVVNAIVSTVWTLLISLHIYGVITVDLPMNVEESPQMTITLLLSSAGFGVWGMLARDKQKQVFKIFSFLLGSVSQVILANGFFTKYPPFELMMLVCTGMSLWFFLAVFFILRCEGLDGNYTAR